MTLAVLKSPTPSMQALLPAALTKERAAETLCALTFLAYILLIALHPQVPLLGDYGDWTYQGVLLKNHLSGIADPAHALKHYPVPNSLTTLGIGLLAVVFSWASAAKIWLVVYMGIAFATGRAAIRTFQSSWATWLLLPVVFLGLNFWWGFLNFQLGICWVFILVTLLVRKVESRWLYAALLCLLFFTHMIPFLFGCLLLVLWAAETRRTQWLWQTLPSLLLTLWYVVGRFYRGSNPDSAVELRHIPFLSSTFAVYKAGSFLKSFGLVNPMNNAGVPIGEQTLGTGAYIVFFGCALLLCATLLVLFARTLLRREGVASPVRVVKQAAMLFIALAMMAPSDLLGIADPGARLLQVALYTLILVGADRFLRPVMATAAVTLSLFALVLFARLVFAPEQNAQPDRKLPLTMERLGFVEYRIHAAHTRALQAGEMRLKVFPTAMFLNVSGHSIDPAANPELTPTQASPPRP